jgi:hypothetical protein
MFFFIEFPEYYLELVDESYVTSKDPLCFPPYSRSIYSSCIRVGYIVYHESLDPIKGISLEDRYYIKDTFCFGLESG